MSEPRVCLVVCMRDAAAFLPGFRRMVEAFTPRPARIVLGENGSTDGTAEALAAWAAEDPRVDAFSFINPAATMPRIATAERSAYMADVWNVVVERALGHAGWTHALVTSAQKWSPPGLTARFAGLELDVVAAFIAFRRLHYDAWCSQNLDGSRLGNEARPDGQLHEMRGVGGVYLARREVYEAGCRLAPTDGRFCESVAFCEQARVKGFRVWMDRGITAVACWEPTDMERCNREGAEWAGGLP